MAEKEKYRKERRDRAPMPRFARVMLVLSVVHIAVAMAMHTAASISSAALFVLGLIALVLACFTAFCWDRSAATRGVVRALVIAVAVLMLGIAVALTAVAKSQDATADVSYNLLVGMALSLSHWHAINVFLLPTMVAAASFGARIDRVMLSIFSVANAAMLPFFVYYTSSAVFIPVFAVEQPMLQLVYILFAWLFAGLTFVPAIAGDPEHSLRKKPL